MMTEYQEAKRILSAKYAAKREYTKNERRTTERQMLLQVLEDNGTMASTARHLGISGPNLYHKFEALGISAEDRLTAIKLWDIRWGAMTRAERKAYNKEKANV
jgi:DNA-binding NtrC family response regulator